MWVCKQVIQIYWLHVITDWGDAILVVPPFLKAWKDAPQQYRRPTVICIDTAIRLYKFLLYQVMSFMFEYACLH